MLKRIALAFVLPLVVLMPLFALAGEAAVAAATPEAQTTALGLVLQGAVVLLSIALTAALAAFARFLFARTKGTIAEGAVQRLWSVFSMAGEHFHATMKPAVLEALADGKITPEEWADLKKKLVDLVKTEFGPVVGGAIKALGFLPAGAETFLSGMAERALKGIVEKAGGAAPTSAPVPDPDPTASPK